MPSRAIKGSENKDGTVVYVGRALFNGDWLPAKIIPHHSSAFISWNGTEIALKGCEAMVRCAGSKHMKWQRAEGMNIPSSAIAIGRTAQGENLYAGRVYYKGSLEVGKIHPSHGICYVPFARKELAFRKYQVLVNPRFQTDF